MPSQTPLSTRTLQENTVSSVHARLNEFTVCVNAVKMVAIKAKDIYNAACNKVGIKQHGQFYRTDIISS